MIHANSNQDNDQSRVDWNLLVMVQLLFIPFYVTLGNVFPFVTVCLAQVLESWGYLELVIKDHHSQWRVYIRVLQLLDDVSCLWGSKPVSWTFIENLDTLLYNILNCKFLLFVYKRGKYLFHDPRISIFFDTLCPSEGLCKCHLSYSEHAPPADVWCDTRSFELESFSVGKPKNRAVYYSSFLVWFELMTENGDWVRLIIV